MNFNFGVNPEDRIRYEHINPMDMTNNNDDDDNDGSNDEDDEDYEISFGFLTFDEEASEWFVNRAVKFITQCKFFHVEVYFPRTKETCSIDQNNPVYFCNDRDYYRREWHWITINVTRERYNRYYGFLSRRVGQQFDKASIWLFICGSGCSQPGAKDKWNCARLLTTALISSRLVATHLDPNFITVDQLYNLLINEFPKSSKYITSPSSP